MTDETYGAPVARRTGATAVADLAAARGLGRELGTYEAAAAPVLATLLTPLLGVAIGGVLGYYGIVGALASPVGSLWFWVIGVLGVTGVMMTLGSLFLIGSTLARWGSVLHVFASGMVHVPRRGAAQVVVWREARVHLHVRESVESWGRSVTVPTYTVVAPGGARIQVDGTFRHGADVGRHIQEQVKAAQDAAVRRGEAS